MAQLEDEPDEGLSTFSATQQEKKIADKLAENCNDIKVQFLLDPSSRMV